MQTVKHVSGINPKVLRWARERSGHSVDDVASALTKSAADILGWESGQTAPTYVQLEKLAYQLYKRPIALFFFPEPPEESDPKQSFRTLPDFEIENLVSDTRYAIRQAEAMQLTLRELHDGYNPSEQKIFRDVDADVGTESSVLAERVRTYLGVDLATQIGWKNNEEALTVWRAVIQQKGIYVFKRSLKQTDVSGFCLLDSEFPLIYLNNSSAVTRQTFTLFHELCHILLHTNGVTKSDDRYITALNERWKRVEVFCNQFTSDFLVPWADLSHQLPQMRLDDDTIRALANRYKVSREVVLRKLLNKNLVDQRFYETKVEQWSSEMEGRASGREGGNYYATQAAYLGDKFLNLAFGRYYQNRCTIEQLADYLNVKVQNVPGLEQYVLRRAAQ